MNINYVQKLVDSIKSDKLHELNAHNNSIEGENSQDKLAHLAAAIWIADKMQATHSDFETSLTAYLEKTKLALK